MPPARPLITLLTDFGDRDYFVASMKGVILSIHPDARIIDLSHQIAPHRIDEAEYVLRASYRYFPDGTIHVAVVDPGVGSGRRALLVSTARYHFLAPDNGLLSFALREEQRPEVRGLENPRYRLEAQGGTFDGRDLFAPAAAWLAKGEPAASFGAVVDDPVTRSGQEPFRDGPALVGRIDYIDRFGNLISNITLTHLKALDSGCGRPTIRIGDRVIGGLLASYSEGQPDRLGALINSNGLLELFVKEASAAQLLRVEVGAELRVE